MTTCRKRRFTIRAVPIVLLFTAVLLSGCGGSTPDTATQLLGRWKRTTPAGPGDPMETGGEYLEFRQNGLLVDVIVNESTNQAWTTNTATYLVQPPDQIQVTGTCYQGMAGSVCSRVFSVTIGGGHLQIDGHSSLLPPADYTFVSALGPNMPPMLLPPMPSPTAP